MGRREREGKKERGWARVREGRGEASKSKRGHGGVQDDWTEYPPEPATSVSAQISCGTRARAVIWAGVWRVVVIGGVSEVLEVIFVVGVASFGVGAASFVVGATSFVVGAASFVVGVASVVVGVISVVEDAALIVAGRVSFVEIAAAVVVGIASPILVGGIVSPILAAASIAKRSCTVVG